MAGRPGRSLDRKSSHPCGTGHADGGGSAPGNHQTPAQRQVLEEGPGQEDHDVSDILGQPAAPQGRHLPKELPRLFLAHSFQGGDEHNLGFAHIRQDVARADRIAADLLAAEFARKPPGRQRSWKGLTEKRCLWTLPLVPAVFGDIAGTLTDKWPRVSRLGRMRRQKACV